MRLLKNDKKCTAWTRCFLNYKSISRWSFATQLTELNCSQRKLPSLAIHAFTSTQRCNKTTVIASFMISETAPVETWYPRIFLLEVLIFNPWMSSLTLIFRKLEKHIFTELVDLVDLDIWVLLWTSWRTKIDLICSESSKSWELRFNKSRRTLIRRNIADNNSKQPHKNV